ncbi:MAG: WXG100 family type VII secretion target [Lachnospiraceae bacterium]|nr:WXG100 family type VII secretion target [Lachnospiraceae bacterium]
MADTIKVNTTSLTRTKKEIRAGLAKIRSEMEGLSSDVETLNSMWDGEAHAAFVNGVTEDMSLLSEVCKDLQSIVEYEESAVSEYKKCEQEVSDRIAQIDL